MRRFGFRWRFGFGVGFDAVPLDSDVGGHGARLETKDVPRGGVEVEGGDEREGAPRRELSPRRARAVRADVVEVRHAEPLRREEREVRG